jgi:hypothetical protein
MVITPVAKLFSGGPINKIVHAADEFERMMNSRHSNLGPQTTS